MDDESAVPKVKQLTQEQAIALAQSGRWKEWSHELRAGFQMCQNLLCMDFDAFHESVEKTLGRPVWTHEFAFRENLAREMFQGECAPTMEEIISLIPADKLIVIKTGA